MKKEEISNIWNYYLALEDDFSVTSRYIEPRGQENVYSLEFAKLLILSCTEVETVFKNLCMETENKECGNIGEYKDVILRHFPKITTAKVDISRWGKEITPFNGWDEGKLEWWDTYTKIKHHRGSNFQNATYKNAIYALAALHILIIYLAKICGVFPIIKTSLYITSDYILLPAFAGNKNLPDFV